MISIMLLGVFGWTLLIAGIVGVHNSRKHSPWYFKVGSVALAGIGALGIWSAVAKTAPALNNPELIVMESTNETLLLRVGAENIRNCKYARTEILTSTLELPVKTELVYSEKTTDHGVSNEHYFIRANIKNIVNKDNTLKVSIEHSCPLGIKIDTDIGEIKLTKQ